MATATRATDTAVKRGIDVSYYQGVIDWRRVKASGKVDYAILKCGETDFADPQFLNNYKGAKAASVPIGAYYFSRALTVSEALKEAEYVIKLLAGKQFEYPIYYDFEWVGNITKEQRARGEYEGQFLLSKAQSSAIITTFCNALEKAGYWVGIYASDSWFYTHIDAALHKRYAVWSAKVKDGAGNISTSPPTFAKPFQMWQNSWVGHIDGINAKVDTDLCYCDYPTAIKAKRLNGFSTVKPQKYIITVNGVAEGDVDGIRNSIKQAGYSPLITKEV